jgi:predicted nucleotidyltransferase
VDRVLEDIVERLVGAYEPERIYLFGSTARDEAGPDSDYDLLVIVPDDAPPDRRRSRLAYEALRGTGIAVDVIVWPRSYFEGRRQVPASLSALVEREGKLLHVA